MTLTEAQDIIEAGAPGPYYAESYRGFEVAYLPAVCELIAEQSPGRVLEVGPGWGTTMLWMAAQGWQVEVWDMIALGVWITPELLARSGATFRRRDVFEGPLECGAYDLIVMTQVIAHLKFRADAAVGICKAMLKPGGQLIVTALDPECAQCASAYGADWQAVPAYGEAPPCPDMVVCLYTQETLEELLRTHFGQVRVWRQGCTQVNFGICVKEGR